MNRSAVGAWVLIFVFLASCKGKTEEKEETVEASKTAVTVITPGAKRFLDYIELNGNTQFQIKTVIRANITGYISFLRWRLGDRISKTSLFCDIKTKEQDALKNIDMREPSLRQFQTPISVRSGSSGVITAINYAQGDFVTEGDVLATVTDPASLVLQVNVPYEYHNKVYAGKQCTVTFPDGSVIGAVIQKEVPYVDSASQTQTYLIRLPGNRSMPENLNLIVRLPVKESNNALALPLDAIQTDETQEAFWVMKLVNDTLAVKTTVTVGLQHDSMREILSGLKGNDRVILKGAYGLSDSAAVTIIK